MEDLELARKVANGDEASVRVFMDTYFPRVYRFVRSMLRNEADVEEVSCEVVAIAARKMHQYRGEASLLTWLFQIARREAYRRHGRLGRQQDVFEEFDDDAALTAIIEGLEERSTPEHVIEQQDIQRIVHQVLEKLPMRQGDVLEWKYIEGLSIREIAERMDVGVEAVQSLLARGRKSFRQAMLDYQRYRYTD